MRRFAGCSKLRRARAAVRELDIELIDNAFKDRFEVASKSSKSKLLSNVQSAMVAIRVQMTYDEARTIWPRIKAFHASEGESRTFTVPIPSRSAWPRRSPG